MPSDPHVHVQRFDGDDPYLTGQLRPLPPRGVRAMTPDAVAALAEALHKTGLNSIGKAPGNHGRYTDRCICNPDAADILAALAANPDAARTVAAALLAEEVLAEALVDTFRAEALANWPWLRGDGWPAYSEHGQPEQVLLVDRIAAAILAALGAAQKGDKA